MLALLRSPWGRDTALRGVLAALLAALVACAVGAATDEGGVGWPLRISRTLPLVPICSGAGAWLALGAARARGEVIALGALGVAPSVASSAACAGAASVSLAAALAIATTPAVDVGAFFPAARSGGPWRYDGTGFVDAAGEIRVLGTGEIARLANPVVVSHGDPRGARAAAALVTLAAGIALSLVLSRTHAGNATRTFALVSAAGLSIVIALQAAAASVAPIALAPALAGAFLFAGIAIYRGRDA